MAGTIASGGPLVRITGLDPGGFLTYRDLGGLEGPELDALIGLESVSTDTIKHMRKAWSKPWSGAGYRTRQRSRSGCWAWAGMRWLITDPTFDSAVKSEG